MEKGKRGKKICPNCGAENGPRSFSCNSCGHEFKSETLRKRPKYVPQGLSRGQKKCPSCFTINAARTRICVCGYEFKKKDKPNE